MPQNQHHSHYVPVPSVEGARKKKLGVVTSVQMSLMFTIMIGVVCFMTSFTDLLNFMHNSRQATLKYSTHLYVIVPLVLVFICQQSLMVPLFVDKKLKRARQAQDQQLLYMQQQQWGTPHY
jgi:hypothetical protein